MKHKKLKIILTFIMAVASICSCTKDPIGYDALDKEQKYNEEDSTGTSQGTVQPQIDAGTVIILF